MKYIASIGVLILFIIGIVAMSGHGLYESYFPMKTSRGISPADYYYNPFTQVVYYIPAGNWFEFGCIAIPGADFKSFTEIAEVGYAGAMARDKSYIYVGGNSFGPDTIDGRSVAVIGQGGDHNYYIRDDYHVYMLTNKNGGSGYTPVVVSGVSPDSFTLPPEQE